MKAFGELNRKFGDNGIAQLPTFISDYRHVTDVSSQGQDIIVSALTIDGQTDEHYYALARFNSQGALDFNFGKPAPSSSKEKPLEDMPGHAFGKFEKNAYHSASEAVTVSDQSIWVLGWLAERRYARRLPVLAELDRNATSLRKVHRLSLPDGSSIRSSEGRFERPIYSRVLVDQDHLIATVNFERYIDYSVPPMRHQKARRHYPPRLYRLTVDGQPGFADSRSYVEVVHRQGPVTITGLAASPKGLLVSGYVTKEILDSAFVARYLIDGTLDTSFGDAGFITFRIGTLNTRIRHFCVLPEGQLLVAGALRSIDEYPDAGWIQQYTENGQADLAFNNGEAVLEVFRDEEDNKVGVEWKTLSADNDGIIAWGESANGYFYARRYKKDGAALPHTPLAVPYTVNALCSLQRDKDIVIATNTWTDKGFVGSLSSFGKSWDI